MKKFLVLIGIISLVTALVSCGKKNKEEASLIQEIAYENEAMNGSAGNDIIAPAPSDTSASIPATTENAAALSNTTIPSNPTSKDIQQALKNAGLYVGKIDGALGPKSKQAIRDFQAKNDLKADGKVGPKTWKKLGPYLGQSTQIMASNKLDTNAMTMQNATSLGE